MGNQLKNNWAVLLLIAAIAGSGYISYSESKDTAAQIATKAEKRAVKKATKKAAKHVYDATVDGCRRDNDRAQTANENVKKLRKLGVSAEYVDVVDCRKQYAAPKP